MNSSTCLPPNAGAAPGKGRRRRWRQRQVSASSDGQVMQAQLPARAPKLLRSITLHRAWYAGGPSAWASRNHPTVELHKVARTTSTQLQVLNVWLQHPPAVSLAARARPRKRVQRTVSGRMLCAPVWTRKRPRKLVGDTADSGEGARSPGLSSLKGTQGREQLQMATGRPPGAQMAYAFRRPSTLDSAAALQAALKRRQTHPVR
jgi:hypothetical protein